jgi:hypothetical protein
MKNESEIESENDCLMRALLNQTPYVRHALAILLLIARLPSYELQDFSRPSLHPILGSPSVAISRTLGYSTQMEF